MVHRHIGPAGNQVVEAQFYIERRQHANDPHGMDQVAGLVRIRSSEQEDGRWKRELVAIDIPGEATHFLIKPSPVISQPVAGWNPFGRWFSS
jgi:hypothetical protein